MAKETKEVAVANPFSNDLPSYINPESDRGSQNVNVEDLALPRLSIIQDLSPQHKKNKPEYIEGAEPGMIFNSVTSDLYGQSVFVVPVHYEKEWLLWKDQDKGGGFRGVYATEAEAVEAKASYEDSADIEVVDTAQHYVLVVVPVEGGKFRTQEAVISMSKSQMKVNRKWNSAIRLAGGDRFSRVYNLEVVDDKNAAGQEYYNWRVTSVGYAPKDVFDKAEQMYEAVSRGDRKVDRGETVVTEADHIEGADLDDM